MKKHVENPHIYQSKKGNLPESINVSNKQAYLLSALCLHLIHQTRGKLDGTWGR